MTGFKKYAQQFLPSQALREVWRQLTMPYEKILLVGVAHKNQ